MYLMPDGNTAALMAYEARYARECDEWESYIAEQEERLAEAVGEGDYTGKTCWECHKKIRGFGYCDGYINNMGDIYLQYYCEECAKEGA